MGVFFWCPTPRQAIALCLCTAQHLFVQETKLGSVFSPEMWTGSMWRHGLGACAALGSDGLETGVAVVVKSNCNKTGDVMSGPEQTHFTALLLCWAV